jgi:RNA polymerase sigma-70 factor, ECF subfamily
MEPCIEQYRCELLAFGYRSLGSLLETERLVEQTLSLAPHRENSVRTMLYKTMSKICLDVMATHPRRTLPALSGPPADPAQPPAPPETASTWLEPFPDDLFPELRIENEVHYGARESVSLPFIAALQFVSPLERIVVILCDTMGWPLDRAAEALETSISNVNGALDKARTTMVQQYKALLGKREPPGEEKATVLSMRYLHSWETANVYELVNQVASEVKLQIPPSPSWYLGRDAVRQYVSSYPLAGDARGRWRLLPRRANGQLAFGVYERDDSGLVYRAHSIQVLTFEEDRVSEIVSFANRSLIPAFRLRTSVIAQGTMVSRDD